MRKVRSDQRVGLLLAGVVLLTFLSIGATVALPATDPSLSVDAREFSADEAEGMEIFRSKGLWYCHGAYVRETAVDRATTGLPATTPEDVAGVSPVMLGLERIASGPDDATAIAEACGVRLSEEEVEAVQAFLRTRTG